ncbi:MAG TPA: HAD family hydrolase [Candidatus Dormibacteraeota bacterium]
MTTAPERADVAAVLFDYGGTLVTFHRPDAALDAAFAGIERLLRDRGQAPPPSRVLLTDVHDRVENAFAAHQRSGRLEEINLAAEARHAYADLGLELDDELLDEVLHMEQEAWWQGVTVDPEAVPTLDALRSRGLRVGLCSNAPYRVRSMHDQLAHFGLDGHLDSVTFSGQVGWRKPSPRIFQAATEALGVAAARTVMVGDSLSDDVDGARNAGMQAVWLRRGTDAHVGPSSASPISTIDRLSALTFLLFGTAAL